MKALVCKQFGSPLDLNVLSVQEVPIPIAAAGQVVVRIAAAALNFPDALIVQGTYQFKPPLPFTPGAEVAGTIHELGAGLESMAHLKVGASCVAFCMTGGFAEFVAVDAMQVLPISSKVDPVLATAALLTYGTSYHALKDRAHIQPGETLLVLGAGGGVGLAAVELGVKMGAKVIAAASTLEKLEAAKALGATELINYSEHALTDAVKSVTGGKGVDVIYDPVGGAMAEKAVRLAGWRGRYLVVGFAEGAIPSIPLNVLLLKGSAVMGVWWGEHVKREPQLAQANLVQLTSWLGKGELHPHVSQTLPLHEVALGLQQLQARQVVGKLVAIP